MDRWVFQHPVDPPDENYRGRVLSVLLGITFLCVCLSYLSVFLFTGRERQNYSSIRAERKLDTPSDIRPCSQMHIN